ncbi:MAG: calcium-binding protein, partial [Exilibacterium sp.]
MTDSLAVYNLLAQLDPNLSTGDYKSILNASASGTSGSYEGVVDILERFFGINSVALATGNDKRNALYLAIYGIQENTEFDALSGSVSITSLAGLSPTALVEKAKSNIAYRYALQNQLSFVIEGDPSIYASRNTSGDLDVDNFSDQYLQDRADFLALLLSRNIEDIPVNESAAPGSTIDAIYQDYNLSDNTLTTGDAIVGNLTQDTRKFIFGNNESNTSADGFFNGTSNADHIYGMGGADEIHGREGDDYLEGGEGNDSYFFDTGDDYDVIYDDVGDNRLFINGRLISSLVQIAPNTDIYEELVDPGQSNDGSTYSLTAEGLLINVGGEDTKDIISIVNFDKDTNNFGLTFNTASTPEAPSLLQDSIVVGTGTVTIETTECPVSIFIDREYDSADRNMDVSYIYDAALYEPNIPSGNEDPDSLIPYRFDGDGQNDILTGSVHSEIVGYVGTDFLDGREGDDLIYGDDLESGTGDNDVLTGGKGSDQVFGGLGDDYLIGWNDRLVPLTNSSLPTPESDPNRENTGDQDYLDGGDGDDVLAAGRGQDTLIGGAGNDFISANVGDDRIFGGDGDDYISGDSYVIQGPDVANFYLTPDLHLDIENQQDFNDIIDGGAGTDIIHGEAGDDIIYGGEGDDFIYGDRINHKEFHRLEIGGVDESDDLLNARYDNLAVQYHGNDILNGGAGEDRMFGSGGDDRLFGGQGIDYLFGDDVVLGSEDHGDDTLDGGEDDDLLIGGGGTDILYGGEGNDDLYGDDGPKSQVIVGGVVVSQGPPAYSVNGHEIEYAVDTEYQLQDFLYGGAGSDRLYGHGGDDYLDGGAGTDFLYGGAGNDTLIGGGGPDRLEGGSGDDTLIDGIGGGDVLIGGAGQDVYVFSTGGGEESIDDESIGQIEIGGNITELVQDGSTTYISYGNTDKVVLVNNSFTSVVSFTLNDSVVNIFDYLNLSDTTTISGTYGDDVIHVAGATQLNSVYGNTGDDLLYADAMGDYTLVGEAGVDHYAIAQLGQSVTIDLAADDSGQDVIELPVGVTVEDIVVTGDFNSLKVLILDPQRTEFTFEKATTVTIEDYLNSEQSFAGIQFDDATMLTAAEILANIKFVGDDNNNSLYGSNDGDTLEGNGGNDTLDGQGGDDTLIGGTGNDTLAGGSGSDTFVYTLGDGNDVITPVFGDDSDYNVLKLIGIAPEELAWKAKYLDLVATLPDGGTITLKNACAYNLGLASLPILRELRFEDSGESMLFTDILDQYGLNAFNGDDGDNFITGTDQADYIDGGAGTDVIDPKGGDDYIVFNESNDFTVVRGRNYGDDFLATQRGGGYTISVLFEDETIAPEELNVFLMAGKNAKGQYNGSYHLHLQLEGE